MRRLVTLSLGLAAVASALAAAPAAATCMEHVNKGGVVIYTCSAPGGEPTTSVCVRGTCVET